MAEVRPRVAGVAGLDPAQLAFETSIRSPRAASAARGAASSSSATWRASSSWVGPVASTTSAVRTGMATAIRRRNRPGPRWPRRRPRAPGGSAVMRSRRTNGIRPGGGSLSRPQEPERVVPGLARRRRAGVLGACRGAFAGEPVARVEAPQAAEAVDPVGRRRRRRSASIGRSRPARRQPVAAGVVDERDATAPTPASSPGRPGRPGAGRRARRRGGRSSSAVDRPQRGQRHLRHVLALLEVRRVRPGAGEDDRVVVLDVEGRVVPAAAQVVADVVVGGAAEPARDRAAAVDVLEHDERLLQVRLVVVRAEERRAPVVHGVDVQVLEHDPAVAADDPAVVDDPRILGSDRLVALRRRGRRPTGTRPRTSSDAVKPASTRRANSPTRARRPGARNTGDRAAGSSGRARSRPWAAGRTGDSVPRRRPAARAASRSRVSCPAGHEDLDRTPDAASSRSHDST